MGDRERLMIIIEGATELYPYELEAIADKLIAHGVVVREDGCEVCRRHVPPGANYCWKCGRPLR